MSKLGFQLYCARFEPSLDQKLKALAEIGYEFVEPYGGLYQDLDDLVDGMKRHNLRARTGHFGFDMLRTDVGRTIEIAKTLEMEYAVVSALPHDEREKDLAGWKAVAQELEEFGKRFRDAGVPLAWHNHAFEFARLEDGQMPLDHLLGSAPSVSWQVDIGWVWRGEQDPMAWFSKFGDRVVSVHLKDIAPQGECEDEDGWADFGHGILDWSTLWPAVAALKPQAFVVEHDKPSDYQRFARRSLATFERMSKES